MSEPPGSPREARVPDDGVAVAGETDPRSADRANRQEERPLPEEDGAGNGAADGTGDETEERTEDRSPQGYEPL